MVDPRGTAKADDDYEYSKTEKLPVVIESNGENDNVHERIRRAFKELGIADNLLLLGFITRDLTTSGTPLFNVAHCEPDAKVEAGIRDGKLHLRIVHSWWFDIKTGSLTFKEGLGPDR